MLVPEVHPAPKPTRHPGRVQVVLGGTARETQVLNLSEAEARAWAMAGSPGNGQPITLRKAATEPDPGEQHPPHAREGEPDTGAQPPEDELVSLREAQRGLAVVSLAALRWARANDPEFPTPTGKRGTELLYRVGDLQRWARNRPRAAG